MKKLDAVIEYEKAQAELKRIGSLQDEESQVLKQRERDISSKFLDLKYDLEVRERKELAVVARKKERLNKLIAKEREPHHKVIKDLSLTYDMMNVYLTLDPPETIFTTKFEDIKSYLHDTLIDDKYKKVWITITENKKPTNKWTLSVVFRSIFQWKFTDYNFGSEVKHLPTPEDLKVWYIKNKDDLRWRGSSQSYPPTSHAGAQWIYLNDILLDHASLEARYEQAIEMLKDKRWQRAYWQHRKSDIERTYRNGVIDREDYKEAQDNLLLLSTADKKLPLLIGSMKSEAGKDKLSRRLKNETL